MSTILDPTVHPSRTNHARFAKRAKQVFYLFGSSLVTLLAISVITFVATSRPPEEVARTALGRDATQSQLDSYVAQHQLNRPLVERYVSWLGDFLVGDWGTSLATGNSVSSDVAPRLSKTLILVVSSLSLSIPIGLAVGVFMARRISSPSDVSLSLMTVILTAIPEFVKGIGLLLLFGVALRWLPVDSTGLIFSTSVWDSVAVFVLPIATLVLASAPYIVRITRASMREALASSFTQAALLRGLPRRRIIWDYAMRNAAVSILNALAISFVYLMGGVIVVENVFGIPGVGQWLVESVSTGDFSVVQAIAVVIGAILIGMSLITDMLVIYFNPRYRTRAH